MNKKTILSYALGPIGTAGISFITIPLITWFYSIEDVGRISMLQVVASFSLLLFCLGLDQAYAREYHETDNKPALLKASLLPGLVLIITTYFLIFIINPEYISDWLFDIPSIYLSMICIACFILTFLSHFLSLILRMEERALAYSMSQLFPKILFLLFLLTSTWLGFKKDTYNLVTAHIFSIAAIFFVLAINTFSEWKQLITVKISLTQFKSILLFGIPLILASLSSWGLSVMDKLFLRSMSTFTELGIYSVTTSIAGGVAIFSGIFNTIWSPLIYKWHKQGVDLTIINIISEHLMAAITFITIISGIFSWILSYFLPYQYDIAQYLITACILSPLLYTLSETTAVGITLTRKTKYSMYASFVAMLINATGNYLLVPTLGATGATISTVIAFWAFYILRTEFSKLVWKKISYNRAYLITSSLSILSIIQALNILDKKASIMIWISSFLISIFIFKNSINIIKKNLKRVFN